MKKKTFIIIIASSLLFWELDNVIDNYFLLDRPVTSFFSDPPHEIFMRLTTIIVIFMFGLVISRYSFLTEESQGRFRQLFDNINDLIFVHGEITENQAGRFNEVNQAAWQHLGYTREELLQTPPLHIFAPEVRQDFIAKMQTLISNKHVLFESTQLRKNGSRVAVEVESHLFEFSGKIKIITICRDISKRQAAQNLTAQLLAAQDNERRRLSMELHDELGQDLTYLKFQMGLLSEELSQADVLTAPGLNSLLTQVDELIEKVRRITQEMSPVVLEELGLSSAIRFQMELFSERFDQVQVAMEIDEIDNLFPLASQLHIFRIVQESLTNIIKHAHASSVSLSVKRQSDWVAIVVSDNGQGFDLQPALEHDFHRGVGIASIEERLRLLGGSLNIWSQTGSGTRFTYNIPIDTERFEHETLQNYAC